MNSTFSTKAQKAALMFSANRTLSHNPPSSWTFYNADAAEAASNSNICYQYSGVYFLPGCIDAYMRDDESNNSAVGHRRWILYPQTQQMGTGDVSLTPGSQPYPYANALWVFNGNWGATRPSTRDEFVAWPPPGYVPYQTLYSRWSFSYPQADFQAAAVTMRDSIGATIPLSIAPISNGYGENTIVWTPVNPLPAGVLSQDAPIDVRITGVSIGGQTRSYSYRVTVFDPAVATPFAPFERLGVYRSGRWILVMSTAAVRLRPAWIATSPSAFRAPTPLRGDWNGDGKDDVGVYADGFWFSTTRKQVRTAASQTGNTSLAGPELRRLWAIGTATAGHNRYFRERVLVLGRRWRRRGTARGASRPSLGGTASTAPLRR
ncbi:MAG: CAP domain-containing protein [Bryobacterales bacterium]